MKRRNIPIFLKILKRWVSREDIRTLRIREAFHKFSKQISNLGFENKIMFFEKKPYICVDNIWLSTLETDRYFLSNPHNFSSNDAARCVKFLTTHKIYPSVIFDIGSNFGEHSLYYALSYPAAIVYSIEPSSQNLRILRLNSFVNQLPNHVIVEIAISDQNGKSFMTNNIGSENYLITSAISYRDCLEVTTMTLFSFMNSQKVEILDFVKIDIEGSEFLLKDCILENHHRIKCLFIEFGSKGIFENESSFIFVLSEYYEIYFSDGKRAQILDVLDSIKKSHIDLFFLHKK